MSLNVGYSLTDSQLNSAMEKYEYSDIGELKQKIRSDIDDFMDEEVLSD